MEKLKKEKHNHKLTDLLKVAIFSMVMLAPIFSVVSKVMYVSLNKNAYQSYSQSEEFTYYEKQETLMPSNVVNDRDDIIIDNYYKFECDELESSALLNVNGQIDLTLIKGQFFFNGENDFYINDYYRFDSEMTTIQLQLANNGNSFSISIKFIDLNDTSNLFEVQGDYDYFYCYNTIFKVNYFSNLTQSQDISMYIQQCEYYETTYVEKTINQSTLDNTFEYAVNGLVDNNLYNWAQDTFAYTSINAMCTGLSVQNGVLPLLLSYWVIITAIYIVFDIILFAFTKLTHLLQD